MTRDEILGAPSMPAFSPSYPHGPFRFVGREYLIITYETDPEIIRADLPARKIVGGRHQIVDFTVPYGRVLHDYLA